MKGISFALGYLLNINITKNSTTIDHRNLVNCFHRSVCSLAIIGTLFCASGYTSYCRTEPWRIGRSYRQKVESVAVSGKPNFCHEDCFFRFGQCRARASGLVGPTCVVRETSRVGPLLAV